MNINGKRVLITGGSSGIGFQLAKALSARGARLLIAGRRPEALSMAAAQIKAGGGDIFFVASDVTSGNGRLAMMAEAQRQLGGLDILVNNAGGVRAGRLEQTSEDEIRAMIEVDLVAPILLTRAAIPQLRQSGEGLIVNVASGIALVGVPFYSTYAAAKAGLGRFGEALRRELNGEGIHVLTAYPSATDTPMMATSHAGPEQGFNKESAAAVAAAIVEAIEKDELEVVRGGPARASMIAMNREFPKVLDQRFLTLKPALEEAVRDHRAL